ncbi:hypothetical protein MTR67_030031 [Solanum verrucosum]|uniref:Uncharacterized protein n=1 Tax=Solanum verrucosum TaxID=315347 RepID=A0AAF0R6Z2_SOLVR|nr:hypothetical protein MTR67_030031 [Solanum verrucosum]
MTHGLPLKVDGDDKCLTMLHAVEETIARQLRACKATLSKKRVTEDIEPLQNNPDLEEGFCKSLLCRLRFRKDPHAGPSDFTCGTNLRMERDLITDGLNSIGLTSGKPINLNTTQPSVTLSEAIHSSPIEVRMPFTEPFTEAIREQKNLEVSNLVNFDGNKEVELAMRGEEEGRRR